MGKLEKHDLRSRLLLLATVLGIVALPCLAADGNWPSWRGPEGTGWSPDGSPPTSWSESENVKWKTAIAGKGHASPVVWKDRIFVTTAEPVVAEKPVAGESADQGRPRGIEPTSQRYLVLALARDDGNIVWQRQASEMMPAGGIHRDGTWASTSPVTDGKVLVASFGSQGLFAYDLEGELLWSKDLGDMQTRRSFGEGSSPAIHGDSLVINWDHEGQSFITTLDLHTGAEKWRRERDEVTSWSTPIVVEVDGRQQIVVAATGASRGYDLETGDVIWELGGMTVNVVPSPVFGKGLVYLASGFRGNALQAVRLAGAKGKLDGTESVVFSHDRHTPYVPSPLLTEHRLYFLKTNSAILTALDAVSGEVVYTEKRVDGLENVYSSIVGADGRIYVTGRNGMTVVLSESAEYEVLARNQLDEGFEASPAIAGKEIFLRGPHHVYCIAEEDGNKDGTR